MSIKLLIALGLLLALVAHSEARPTHRAVVDALGGDIPSEADVRAKIDAFRAKHGGGQPSARSPPRERSVRAAARK